MSGIKKYLTPEGAQALRNFAASMPVAIENINQSTARLYSMFNSLADTVGYHSDSFAEMIEYVDSAQKMAAEAIEELPKELEKNGTSY